MSEWTPAAEAALGARRAAVFGAVEMTLPGHDVRLIAGSIELEVFGEEFSGRDAVFGTIASVDAPKDGVGDEAPGLTITLLPPSGADIDAVAAAGMQGARVRLIFGPLDTLTGLVVPDPIVLFDGEVDVATPKWRKGAVEVAYRCGSVFTKFFELEEGIRLSDAWLQGVWPGALGLAFVTGVAEPVPWGTNDLGSVVTK